MVNIFLEFHEDIIAMEGGARKWQVAAVPNGEGVLLRIRRLRVRVPLWSIFFLNFIKI